jgi:hypothetical protein
MRASPSLIAIVFAVAAEAQQPVKAVRLCPAGTADTASWVEPDTAGAPIRVRVPTVGNVRPAWSTVRSGSFNLHMPDGAASFKSTSEVPKPYPEEWLICTGEIGRRRAEIFQFGGELVGSRVERTILAVRWESASAPFLSMSLEIPGNENWASAFGILRSVQFLGPRP